MLNAFRQQTYEEFCLACADASADAKIGVLVITGAGKRAFSSGGDVRGYEIKPGKRAACPASATISTRQSERSPSRRSPWCGAGASGGQCPGCRVRVTIASETAMFGQNGPRMGSYNPWGFAYMTRIVGEKKAREMWFLCRRYTAQEALEMGLVNKVVPDDKLEAEVDQWCEEILSLARAPGGGEAALPGQLRAYPGLLGPG